MNIIFTAITEDNLIFLKKVYRSTREEELRLTSWDEKQKSDFIDQQFNAQHVYYHQVYEGASFSIIQTNNQPAGRLYIWETESQIRIIDIALLPEFRGQGIGSFILQDLIKQSELKNKIISIHVENFNPAMSWYERLGFKPKDETGVYLYLEREPTGT
jgi:ribosomal protein S18 acetylase RimI-like enzyme